MESPSLAPEPAAGEARCQSHPDQAVLGTCARCGTFFCELDRENVHGRYYCATCARLPEVNPTAHPPIGRRGQAIAGIVLSTVSMVGWSALLVATRLNLFGD